MSDCDPCFYAFPVGSFETSQDLFASPFAPPTSWQFDNYSKIVGESGLGVAFRNSVIVAVSARDSLTHSA